MAEARNLLVRALIGPEGEAEMRLERVPAAELRRDGALLLDSLKAVGFFPGPRAVLVEDATDGLAPSVASALDAWTPADARLVVTGTGLNAKGALRKLVEGRRDSVAITLYDDPPTEAEIDGMLREAGLARIDSAAREELSGLAQSLTPGDFRGLVERLSLYQAGAPEPLVVGPVLALAPQAGEADVDELLAAVTGGRRDRIAPLMTRLAAEGVGPVTVAIQALRHMRTLLAVASDPNGVQAGLAALRPPVGGARRQALSRAAESWRRDRIEDALMALVGLDLELRSGSKVPDRALLERVLIRLATTRSD